MNAVLMAMEPQDRRRLGAIVRPKPSAMTSEQLDREITAIEEHIKRLREILAEEDMAKDEAENAGSR